MMTDANANTSFACLDLSFASPFIETAANVGVYYEQYQVPPEKVNLVLLPVTAQDKARVYTLSLETSQQKSVVGKLILSYPT